MFLAVFPRPPMGTVTRAAHEAETNHEMELHPPVLVRTRDGMGGFFQGRTRSLALFLGTVPDPRCCWRRCTVITRTAGECRETLSTLHGKTKNIAECLLKRFLKYYNIPTSK